MPGTHLVARAGALAIGILLMLAAGSSTAGAAVCGDGIPEYPEHCDDGNTLDGDGCSAGCLDECPSLTGDWLAQSTAPGSNDAIWQFVEGATGDLTVDTGFDTLTGTRSPGVRSPVTFEPSNEPFTLSGEMLTCDQIFLEISLLPYTITLTRQVEPPSCPDALPLTATKLALSGLTLASGKQGLVASGRIVLAPGMPFVPSTSGVQVLLDDLGSGAAHVFDVTHLTRPIPSLAAETCFARGEGWRASTYRSVMKPLDPPECQLGGAGTLSLRLRDLRPRSSEASFTLRVSRATIAPPVGPLRLTLALGTTAEALAAARCGDPQPVLACTASANQKTLRCR